MTALRTLRLLAYAIAFVPVCLSLNLGSHRGVAPVPVPTIQKTDLPGHWSYAGCLQELTNPHVLPYQMTNNSAVACMNQCAAFGYPVAGVEYGQECYCGDLSDASLSTFVPDSQCDMACTGDPIHYCGARNRLTLYTSQLPESRHDKTILFKNLGTGFLLTASIDHTVSAHPEDFVGVANTWNLVRKGRSDEWAIRSSGICAILGKLPIEGYYLAANGPPGTSSLKVQEEPFHWKIVLDESRTDFLIKSLVPSTAPDGIVVTQVSETGVDIQPYDPKANSPYQRWILNLV